MKCVCVDKRKSPAYLCRNNKTQNDLGIIEYYSAWQKYIFEGAPHCVFDESCLLDIVDFLRQLKEKAIK